MNAANEQKPDGTLFILSAPSGTGKTTLAGRLVNLVPNLVLSRSYTSRVPRVEERQGVDYNFVSRHQFEQMVNQNQFLEWAEIFGELYGTVLIDAERELVNGRNALLVINVDGARQLMDRGYEVVKIFILPPSLLDLEMRLKHRNPIMLDMDMKQRLETAKREIQACREYDHIVVNDDLDECINELRTIVIGEETGQGTGTKDTARILSQFTAEFQNLDPS
jgi:guanylate kinase